MRDEARRGGSTATAQVPDQVDSAISRMFGRDAAYMGLWAVQALAGALVTPVVTRLMPPNQFGLLATATAVMQVLFAVAGLGLSTAVQREHARGRRAEAHKLLLVVVLACVVLCIVVDRTGALWSHLLGYGRYDTVLRLAVLWSGITAITTCALSLLRSKDWLWRFAAVSLLQSVVAQVLSLALVEAHPSPAAQWYLVGQVGAQGAGLVLVLVLAPPALLARSDAAMVLRSLRFSLPLVPAALSGFVLEASDRLVLHRYLGAGPVAGYQVAYNLASAPQLVVFVLGSAWLPRLFGLTANQSRVIAASRDAVFRLLVPVTLGLSIGGPVVLRLWVPASYRPDALAMTFAIIVISTVPYAAMLSAERILVMSGSTSQVAVWGLTAAGANVAANVVLVPLLGVLGAAVATWIAYAVLWLSLAAAAHRVMPLARVPVRLVAALVLSSGAAVLSALAPIGGGLLGIRLAVAVVALAGVALEVRRIRTSSARSAQGAPARG